MGKGRVMYAVTCLLLVGPSKHKVCSFSILWGK